jgi:hypothetical protein
MALIVNDTGPTTTITDTVVLNGLDPDLFYQDRVAYDADRTVPNRCGQLFPQNTPLFDVP